MKANYLRPARKAQVSHKAMGDYLIRASVDKQIDNSRDPNTENHSRDQPDLMDFIETYFWEPD